MPIRQPRPATNQYSDERGTMMTSDPESAGRAHSFLGTAAQPAAPLPSSPYTRAKFAQMGRRCHERWLKGASITLRCLRVTQVFLCGPIDEVELGSATSAF